MAINSHELISTQNYLINFYYFAVKKFIIEIIYRSFTNYSNENISYFFN